MKKIIIMIGCPGSGKSTLSSKLGATKIVSRDIIREKLGYIEPGQKALCSPEQERLVTASWWLEAGEEFEGVMVIDDTNVNQKFRDEMITELQNIHPTADIFAVKVDTPLPAILERRDGQIPERILKSMYQSAQQITQEDLDIPLVVVQGY